MPTPNQSRRTFPTLLQHAARGSLFALASGVLACSAMDSHTPSADESGGASATGGTGTAGIAGSGGQSGAGASGTAGQAASGGSAATAGSNATGGTSGTGGTQPMGGAGASGAGAGGAGSGGVGGAGSGGVGGAGAGGVGGAGSGGVGGAGAGGTAGGTSCPFPTSFKWSSTGPLAQPQSPAGKTFVSLKDFTVTKYNNQFIVYASVYDTATAGYSSVNINFTDFAQMGTATQTWVSRNAVAPTLFHFTPKNTWVLTYQWGFQYATSSDPSNPSSWSAGKTLLTGGPTSSTGPIDQTVICDSTNCYLFFATDDGRIHRSSLPIANFPGTFNGYTTILTDTTANLFEAVEVYSVQGTGMYLMIVEAQGSGGRYFRALSATSLSGTFTPVAGASTEATPFAGKKNVTFSGTAWTNDISHGDIVRVDPSETQPIDPCNMQLLYQGRDPSSTATYNELPYRPGLLTKTN